MPADPGRSKSRWVDLRKLSQIPGETLAFANTDHSIRRRRDATRRHQRHGHQGTLTEPVSQAEELWEALDLRDNDQVTDAVLIAKVADFEDGATALVIAATDGVDWVTQLGMIHGALNIMGQQQLSRRDDE